METFDRLQRYVYQEGFTRGNYIAGNYIAEIPIGLTVTSSGKIMVLFTTVTTRFFDVVDDALNYIEAWLDENEVK